MKKFLRKPFNLFPRSYFTTSEALFKFKHTLDLHEHETSCMKVPRSQLTKMSAQEIINNRIASEFLAKPEEIELYYTAKSFTGPKDFNYPYNSFIQIKLPLAENKELRDKYIRFFPQYIRVGRLLEALDFTATFVSYFHCKNEPFSRTCTMITVCVDHLKFFSNLRGDRNILINAYPTFSGKSTVEIRTDLYEEIADKTTSIENKAKTVISSENQENQENNHDYDNYRMAGSALFLMAAREYNDYSKAYTVPQLMLNLGPDSQRAILRSELGKLNQDLRKKQVSTSLFKSPPSEQESLELHEIFIRNEENLRKNINIKYISDTHKTKSLLMHNQDRNIHGKIFGGYLMKESIEFAWLLAYSYTNGDFPEFEAIDDFNFLSFVDIGSILDFDATVTYTEGRLIHVRVEAIKYPKVLKQGEKERQKCTELHITFKCAKRALEPIYPATYEEAMNYLEAKRRVMKQLEFSKY